MALSDEIAVLSTIPLFREFPPAKLKLVAFVAKRVTFPLGTDLCVEGSEAESAYVVIEGTVDVLVQGRDDVIAVYTHGPGSLIGEVAVLGDVRRTATVRATTEVIALEIGRDLLRQMIRDFPDVAEQVTRELAVRLSRTNEVLRSTS